MKLTACIAMALCIAGTRCSASDSPWRMAAQLLVGVDGTFFTGNAQSALGSPKFGSDTRIFARPAVRGPIELTGGLEFIDARDHWQPFSGGNRYALSGLGFRVQGLERMERPIPFVNVGIYYGEVHSYRQSFDAYAWAPSLAAGVEYRFARYLSVTAAYRVTGSIGGVHTDGFTLGIGVF